MKKEVSNAILIVGPPPCQTTENKYSSAYYKVPKGKVGQPTQENDNEHSD